MSSSHIARVVALCLLLSPRGGLALEPIDQQERSDPQERAERPTEANRPEAPDAPPRKGVVEPSSLHLMDPEGRGLRRFLSDTDFTFQGSPVFSADGRRLAFDAWRAARGDEFNDAHVLVCQADGSQLMDLGPGAMPSWSPDGTQLAISSHNPHGVWILKSDGRELRLIDEKGWGVRWSPVANRIAYVSRGRLVIRDLSNGSITAPRGDRYDNVYHGFAWSPDGNWIALRCDASDGASELAVVHVDGESHGFRVLLPAALPEIRELSPFLCWAPDGKQVLAAVTTRDQRSWQLYSIDASGIQPARLLPGLDPDRDYISPTWSPDGKQIVVSTRRSVAK